MFGLGLTVRHYADLGADRAVVGETLDAAGWDALRVETAGAYSLPPTREALEAKAAEFPDISKRAALVNEALDQRGARTVASYGVGAALSEVLMLQQRPSRALLLSDYGPATVQRLRDLLPDTTVTLHDLLTDPPPHATCISFIGWTAACPTVNGGMCFGSSALNESCSCQAACCLSAKPAKSAATRRRCDHVGRSAGWVRTRHAYDVCGDALTVTVACGLVMWTGGGASLEPDAEALRV
jgi:hypothetical protein